MLAWKGHEKIYMILELVRRGSDLDVTVFNKSLAKITLPTVNPSFYAHMLPNEPSIAKFFC